MAHIRRYPMLSHLRAEPSSHVLHFRSGRLRRSGRGLAFWFRPLNAALVEVPVDDREQSFLFKGRSVDFQEVTVQGALSYRIVAPEVLAGRVDFGVHVGTGRYLRQPLEQLAAMVTQLAQQVALEYLSREDLRAVLADGVEAIRGRVDKGLREGPELAEMGIELVSVRVATVSPTADMEKALAAPTREGIQQASDEAMFQRRALAVEKERAIAENELVNRIELAKKEQFFIEQQGANDRRRAEEEAVAEGIRSTGDAERRRVLAAAKAHGIEVVESARNTAEGARIGIYRDLPSGVLLGLAARELAGKLQSIEHLNIAPDLFGPMLQNLIGAGTRKLEA